MKLWDEITLMRSILSRAFNTNLYRVNAAITAGSIVSLQPN